MFYLDIFFCSHQIKINNHIKNIMTQKEAQEMILKDIINHFNLNNRSVRCHPIGDNER